MNDRDAMAVALEEARAAFSVGEIPVGAVIVREGTVIARTHNQRETLADPTAHAEILAMRQAAAVLGDWRLTGCALVVTLEPCAMCAAALTLARVSRVVYGARDETLGGCGSLYDLPGDPAFGPAIPVTGGVLKEECAELLRRFFAQRRTP